MIRSPRRKFMSPAMETAYKGENLIHRYLPGSKHVNKNTEFLQPYDIQYKGLDIDVKTRRHGVGNTVQFSNFGQKTDEILILLFMGSEPECWIELDNTKNIYTKKIGTGISLEELDKHVSSLVA